MTKKQRFKRIKAILICSGILLALYYLFPLAGMTLDSTVADVYLGVGLLNLAFPLYVYVSAVYLGIRHGFCSIYAVGVTALFYPTLLIYFGGGSWPAGLVYGGIALAGNLMGWGLHVMWNKMKQENE